MDDEADPGRAPRQWQNVAHKVLSELLVSLPFFFMAVIGVNSRTRQDPFTFESYDQHLNDEVSAYVPFVQAAERAIPNVLEANRPLTRTVAKMWVNGTRLKRIQELRATYFDDTVEEGVKAEIFMADLQLVSALTDIAGNEASIGQWDLCAEDAVLSLQTAEVTWPFDIVSVARDGQAMKRSLSLLKWSLPRTSKRVRSSIHKILNRSSLDLQQLNLVALRYRSLYVRQNMSLEVPMADALGVGRDVTLRDLSNSTSEEGQRHLRNLALNAVDYQRAIFYEKLAAAYKMADGVDRSMKALLAKPS